MTLPDWLPTHCIHCMTYRGHGESDFGECPDECNHNFEHANPSGGQYQCPTCGHEWMAVPPEDWDGSLLVKTERELQEPPPEYSIDQLGLKYSGPKWEAIIGT